MCDMYGHGWYEPVTGRVFQDYMKYNSHGEIPIAGRRGVYPMFLRPKPAPPIDFKAICRNLSDIATTTAIEEEEMWCVPYGIDPTNGRVIIKSGGHDRMEAAAQKIRPADKLIMRATWDLCFATVDEFCPWIEAHYGKRRDEADWVMRGPLLVLPSVRAERFPWAPIDDVPDGETAWWSGGGIYNPRLPIEGQMSCGLLIDAFRKYPNSFWASAEREPRREWANRVLETAEIGT